MKKYRILLLMAFFCLGMMQISALDEQVEASGKNGKSQTVDISRDLQRRLERWTRSGILEILICPRLVWSIGDEDPPVKTKKKLSVGGFGQLEKEDAKTLVSAIDMKMIRVAKLTGGNHAVLYFICANSKFSPLDKLDCYISEGRVDVRLSDEQGREAWVGLPDDCSKLILSKFVKESLE